MSRLVLDMFSGSKSLSKPVLDRGWDYLSIDIDPNNEPDIVSDILKIDNLAIKPDIIWASPPCTTFSIASVSTHWRKRGDLLIAKTQEAKKGTSIALHTLWLIRRLDPEYWFIENPVGMLRKMPFMPNENRRTVTYCQYGDSRRKPTDIWTNCYHWIPRPMCKNGDPCHEAAPRGSRTGTQGLPKNERWAVPEQLLNEILDACANEQKIDFVYQMNMREVAGE